MLSQAPEQGAGSFKWSSWDSNQPPYGIVESQVVACCHLPVPVVLPLGLVVNL